MKEAEKLQAGVQGDLSNRVRDFEHRLNQPGADKDEGLARDWEKTLTDWDEGLEERHGGRKPVTQRKRVGAIPYGGGNYVSIAKKK